MFIRPRVHAGQVRLSGEPYLSHPLEVAFILADMSMDVESVASALLHDVVEDTRATIEEVRDMFGPAVAHIVAGVTKLAALPSYTKQARQAESIRKMIPGPWPTTSGLSSSNWPSRLHNMRTLQYHKKTGKNRWPSPRKPWTSIPLWRPVWAFIG